MPLPNDEKLIALSEEILKQFEAMFGSHPGFRPGHAKGILLAGTFTPSSVAAPLTRAQHAVQASTPVTVRFSDGTGVPLIPDNDPNADPRGMAIRFNLAEHVHLDAAPDGEMCLGYLFSVVYEWLWEGPVKFRTAVLVG